MYIIYLYLLSGVSKFFLNVPHMYVTTLLLVVRISPAQGCLVGGEQTCVPTLLLVVSC